jgi:hypothetical protein
MLNAFIKSRKHNSVKNIEKLCKKIISLENFIFKFDKIKLLSKIRYNVIKIDSHNNLKFGLILLISSNKYIKKIIKENVKKSKMFSL